MAKATIRQRLVFNDVVNGSSISKAMAKHGYSLSTSVRTNKITETKGWKELLEEHLGDDLLAERHKELLNKREAELFSRVKRDENGKPIVDDKGNIIEEHVYVDNGPDTQAVSKALDMAYRLKDKYAAEKQVLLTASVADVLASLEEPPNASPVESDD